MGRTSLARSSHGWPAAKPRRSSIATTASSRPSAAWRPSSTWVGIRFSGLVAWWFWLLAHIYFLIGFRNRLVVLIDWAGAYWTYDRSARIIVDDQDA